ncbi:MAG: DUF5683 domain-containing protein [Candidatus Eisenbacteria bacterium]
MNGFGFHGKSGVMSVGLPLVALWAWLGVGAAWGDEPGETAAPGDTVAAAAAGAGEESRIVGSGLNSPTFVMLRSLLIPGWGQMKNGAWLKAFVVAGIESALLERLYFEDRVSDESASKAAQFAPGTDERARYDWKAEKHDRHRRDFIWWSALFVALSMGDAYVDAHLKRFDVRIQTETPEAALPGGAGATPGIAVQVGLRF